jgi:hypothetical protein
LSDTALTVGVEYDVQMEQTMESGVVSTRVFVGPSTDPQSTISSVNTPTRPALLTSGASSSGLLRFGQYSTHQASNANIINISRYFKPFVGEPIDANTRLIANDFPHEVEPYTLGVQFLLESEDSQGVVCRLGGASEPFEGSNRLIQIRLGEVDLTKDNNVLGDDIASDLAPIEGFASFFSGGQNRKIRIRNVVDDSQISRTVAQSRTTKNFVQNLNKAVEDVAYALKFALVDSFRIGISRSAGGGSDTIRIERDGTDIRDEMGLVGDVDLIPEQPEIILPGDPPRYFPETANEGVDSRCVQRGED